MTLQSTIEGQMYYLITDAIGNRRQLVTIDAPIGWSNHMIDVHDLESGMYTITILPENESLRFVRH